MRPRSLLASPNQCSRTAAPGRRRIVPNVVNRQPCCVTRSLASIVRDPYPPDDLSGVSSDEGPSAATPNAIHAPGGGRPLPGRQGSTAIPRSEGRDGRKVQGGSAISQWAG